MSLTCLFVSTALKPIAGLAYHKVPTPDEYRARTGTELKADNQLYAHRNAIGESKDEVAENAKAGTLAVCYAWNGTEYARVVGRQYLVSEEELSYLRSHYNGTYQITHERIASDDELLSALSADKAAAVERASKSEAERVRVQKILDGQTAKADVANAEKKRLEDENKALAAEIEELKRNAKKGK